MRRKKGPAIQESSKKENLQVIEEEGGGDDLLVEDMVVERAVETQHRVLVDKQKQAEQEEINEQAASNATQKDNVEVDETRRMKQQSESGGCKGSKCTWGEAC